VAGRVLRRLFLPDSLQNKVPVAPPVVTTDSTGAVHGD
jgi:hypothetical protein